MYAIANKSISESVTAKTYRTMAQNGAAGPQNGATPLPAHQAMTASVPAAAPTHAKVLGLRLGASEPVVRDVIGCPFHRPLACGDGVARVAQVLLARQSRVSLEGEILTPGSCTCMRRAWVLLRLKRSVRMHTECALVRQQTFATGVFMIGLSGSTLKRSRRVSF